MYSFAVFGNPIKHSKSPQIYALFAEATGIFHFYGKFLVPKEKFELTLGEFFSTGGMGANITTPFKEQAFLMCDQVTKRASISGVVNTIKKQSDGSLLGDNTDGIGLITDLHRLDFLHSKTKVLLIGAGGAARGVIHPLLSSGCQLSLTNRTFSRAQTLVNSYCHLGNIISIPLCQLSSYSTSYDLIINATTTSINGQIPELPESLIMNDVDCYDMFYQNGNTPFTTWCRQKGAKRCADGLGMLVGQAAHSFLLWHNIFPPIFPVLEKMRIPQERGHVKN